MQTRGGRGRTVTSNFQAHFGNNAGVRLDSTQRYIVLDLIRIEQISQHKSKIDVYANEFKHCLFPRTINDNEEAGDHANGEGVHVYGDPGGDIAYMTGREVMELLRW